MTMDTTDVRHTESVKTPLRNFRCDDTLWKAAKDIADLRRESMSTILKRALVEYVERHGGEVQPKPKEDEE